MAKKYYAVKKGKVPGIYYSWDDCKKQVDGFSGAVYKSFTTLEEADTFINGAVCKRECINENPQVKEVASQKEEEAVAYVDGSYEKSQKRYSYGAVILYKDQIVELNGSGNDPELVDMRNVAGEILGSSYAIKWAIEHGAKSINVFHDYEGVARWANGEWKANKPGTQSYQKYIQNCRNKINIRFTKVAAHTGVELNERADKLAKAALGIG